MLRAAAPPGRAPPSTATIPVTAAAHGVRGAGHMHLLGRSIKIELNPGTAGARTLLDVPEYNFDDQAHPPAAPPRSP